MQAQQQKKWERKITDYLSKIDKMIAVYNEQSNVERIQRPRKFQTVLQLLALKLFMKSCAADGDLESADANRYLSAWYNTLLPGCCAVVNDKDWKDGSFAALMFRCDQLEGLLNQYCADYNVKKLIKQIRELGLAYVHEVDKARISTDTSQTKPVSAVLLRIEKLDFLSQGLREELLKRVTDS